MYGLLLGTVKIHVHVFQLLRSTHGNGAIAEINRGCSAEGTLGVLNTSNGSLLLDSAVEVAGLKKKKDEKEKRKKGQKKKDAKKR
jgi:hypothetical protein